MWDIVWVSPQGHRSVSVSCYFLPQALQYPCSERKWFRRDHCCRVRSKPGCRIVGSRTKWELTTWGDFQLCVLALISSDVNMMLERWRMRITHEFINHACLRWRMSSQHGQLTVLVSDVMSDGHVRQQHELLDQPQHTHTQTAASCHNTNWNVFMQHFNFTTETSSTAATFDNVASSKTLAWSLTSSKVQQKSNHQKLFCCLLSYHFLPHPVSHGLYAVTAGKNNMGALFYSLVDFTDASHLNTLMQVWCIAEINRWINNAPYTTSRNPWHKQVL